MEKVLVLKTTIVISTLIAMMTALATDMFYMLPENYVSHIENNIIGYETLLKMSMLIFLAFLVVLYFLNLKNKLLTNKLKELSNNKSKPNKNVDQITKKEKFKYLKNLNFDERKVLSLFIEQQLKTVKIGNIALANAASELVKKQIIYPQLSIDNPQPFTIDPDVWKYLNKHKNLLNL